MSDLTHLGVAEALSGLTNKDFSAQELTQAFIDRMQATQSLNAYISETPDIALAMAAESDARYAKGEALPLDGIPVGVKDLFCTAGTKTTAASNILGNFIPPYESTTTQNLWDAGAVMLGKTNLDEFAMGSANTTSAFGNVINPWRNQNAPDVDLVPGGSSGGSAAAIAARSAMIATGTDTGGSIRQPASFCGITGIRPTYGRCSRWGVIAFASSLDQAGVFGQSVSDCAHMLGVMAGHDEKDSTSAKKDVPDFAASINGSVKGMRVGVPKEYNIDGLSDEISAVWQQGIEWLRSEGAEIVDVSLPHTQYALPSYYIIAPAEASSNLARYDGVRYGLRQDASDINGMYAATRAAGFGDEVKRRILIGTYVLSAGYYDAYYRKAQRIRRLIQNDFTNAYEQCDVILTPTAPSAPFAIGENEDDPVQMYLNDVFTVTVNLAGLPGISVPAGLDKNGLPLGLQLIGRPWDEATLITAGQALERCANFVPLCKRDDRAVAAA